MRTRLYKYLVISLLAVFGFTGLTGCGDDITEQYYVGSDIYTTSFDVSRSQWKWNSADNRYECFFNVPQLTQKVYDDGAMNVYVFMNPREDNEVQIPLPDIFTYKIDNGDGTYSTYDERISCDFIIGQVGLYLQTSDLFRDDNVLPEKYEFKLVLTWKD